MPEAVSPAWNSDLVANHNLLEWLPAANGQEWMMSRNLDGTSAPGNHLETRFDSAVDPVGDINRLDPTVPSKSMDRSKPALNRLRNSHPLTGCRIVDKRGVAGALTHRGPARDDDQVAVFEPARHPVQVVETRRNPDYSLTALHEDRDPLHRRAEQVVQPRQLPLVPVVGDPEHQRLGLVDGVFGFDRVVVPEPGDVPAGRDQPPLVRLLLDDPAVVLDVRRGRHRALHRRQLRPPADPRQQAHLLQLRRPGDVVDRLSRGEQVQGRAVDLPVVLAVEIIGVQELQHIGDGARVEKDRTDDRYTGVALVRWYPPCGEWKRGRHALRVSGPA